VREANKARKEKEQEEKEAHRAAAQLQKDLKKVSASILEKAPPPSSKLKTTTELSKGPVLKASKVRMALTSPQKKQAKNPKSLVVTPKALAPDTEVVQQGRGGRPIRLPQRFKNTK
jgi:hypothetical protein